MKEINSFSRKVKYSDETPKDKSNLIKKFQVGKDRYFIYVSSYRNEIYKNSNEAVAPEYYLGFTVNNLEELDNISDEELRNRIRVVIGKKQLELIVNSYSELDGYNYCVFKADLVGEFKAEYEISEVDFKSELLKRMSNIIEELTNK